MGSPRLAHPVPTEEWTDSNFPVLSTHPESSDIDNWVSSQICYSDDFRCSPSPVEGYAASSAVVHWRSSDDMDPAAYMRLTWSSNLDSSSGPHSPKEYEFPESPSTILFSCSPILSEFQPQLEDGAAENHQVPLSSSPPEFTSSSPTSDISSEQGMDEGSSSLTSASSGARSDTASISASQHFDCGPFQDQFSRRLHELLLMVLRGRELERSRTRYEETDCTTCSSRSDDSASSGTGFENSENDEQDVVGKIKTSSSPSCVAIRKCFSDQAFVGQASKQTNDISSRSSTSLSYLSDCSHSSDEITHQNISPIRFAIPSNGDLRGFSNAITAAPEAFRIIKRSHSFIQDDKFQDPLTPHKRQKTQAEHSAHARGRLFASRPASLRRADSLKSVPAAGDTETPTQVGYVPTVPATPILAPLKSTSRASTSAMPLINRVPIIAPPPGYVPRLPLSAETLAKIRLGKYLEREGRGREEDGLPVDGRKRPQSRIADNDNEKDSDIGGVGVREEELNEWEVLLGIGQRSREEVIHWILDVVPPLPKKKNISESSATSSSSSSSASSTTSTDRQHSDLMDQLKNSPETRFHAAWMFLRYFYLTMSPDLNTSPGSKLGKLSRQSSLNSNTSASTDQEGRDLMIWDIAVACLALSVKFHRDFLDPLLPVNAHEYLSLAPQRLSYEDLETAQRDILWTFDYSLGGTPQPVMDELWFALESLRNLLHFENGWQTAMADAWCGLFDAICEPDVQRFSMSTLAAVALMDGVVESLVQRYLYEAALRIKAAATSIFNRSASTSLIARENRRRRRQGSSRDSLDWRHELELAAPNNMENNLKGLSRNRKKYVKKAERVSEGVRSDIQAMVGITDAQLRDCRDWFSELHSIGRFALVSTEGRK